MLMAHIGNIQKTWYMQQINAEQTVEINITNHKIKNKFMFDPWGQQM